MWRKHTIYRRWCSLEFLSKTNRRNCWHIYWSWRQTNETIETQSVKRTMGVGSLLEITSRIWFRFCLCFECFNTFKRTCKKRFIRIINFDPCLKQERFLIWFFVFYLLCRKSVCSSRRQWSMFVGNSRCPFSFQENRLNASLCKLFVRPTE